MILCYEFLTKIAFTATPYWYTQTIQDSLANGGKFHCFGTMWLP